MLSTNPSLDPASTTEVTTERVLCLLGVAQDRARKILIADLPDVPDLANWH